MPSVEQNRQSSQESDELRLVIHGSRLPVVRAGWSNFLLIPWLAALFLVGVMADALPVPAASRPALWLVVTVLFLVVYGSALARVELGDGSVLFVCAPWTLRVPINSIEYVSTAVYGSWMMMTLRVKRRSRVLPLLFHFVTMATSYGPLRDTEATLRNGLSRLGISVR